METRLGPASHQLGGTCFWELCRLKEGLLLDYETPDLETTWVFRKYHNICEAWKKKVRRRAGGIHSNVHFFPSKKSFTVAMQQNRVLFVNNSSM